METLSADVKVSEFPSYLKGQSVRISNHTIQRFRERVTLGIPSLEMFDRDIKGTLAGSLRNIDWDKLPKRRNLVKSIIKIGSKYFIIRLVVDKKWKGVITCLGRDSWAQFGLKEVVL